MALSEEDILKINNLYGVIDGLNKELDVYRSNNTDYSVKLKQIQDEFNAEKAKLIKTITERDKEIVKHKNEILKLQSSVEVTASIYTQTAKISKLIKEVRQDISNLDEKVSNNTVKKTTVRKPAVKRTVKTK